MTICKQEKKVLGVFAFKFEANRLRDSRIMIVKTNKQTDLLLNRYGFSIHTLFTFNSVYTEYIGNEAFCFIYNFSTKQNAVHITCLILMEKG